VLLNSKSPEETREFGRHLGLLASPGDVYLLVGPLGAGKTCLVQGLASGLGIEGYVPSPSFVLVRELKGRLPLYHIDLYRLENPLEIENLGLDEYFYGQGVSAVEWADRVLGSLPEENLLIEINYLYENSRQITFSPHGKRYEGLLRAFKNQLSKDV